MQSGGYLTQLLYLLVYSSSLISAASAAVFRKKLNAAADIPLKRLIISIAVCCSLLSIQVFLAAVGFIGKLSQETGSRLILALNMLIFAGIGAVIYSTISLSCVLRPAGFNRKITIITAAAVGGMLLLMLVLQILLFIVHLPITTELLGYLMIGASASAAGIIIFSTIRLYIPLTLDDDQPVLSSARMLFSVFIVFPLFFLLLDSELGSFSAPLGFITLNILSLRMLYVRLTASADRPEPAVNNTAPNPAAACRELGLSKRETDVALLLSRGASYKEIAAELFISMSTTQTHVGRIYSKLDINNKTELSNLLSYVKPVE